MVLSKIYKGRNKLIDLEENSRAIEELKNKLNKIYIALNLEKKEEELNNLENKTLENGFWDDMNSARSVTVTYVYCWFSSVQIFHG